jgi:hypothetical protein
LVIGKYTDVFKKGFFCGGRGLRGRIFHGGREFSVKGAPNFPALFKKRVEIKEKSKFFQPKVRTNIKT